MITTLPVLSPWQGSEGYLQQVELLRSVVLHDCSGDGVGLPGAEALSMIGYARMDNFRAAVEHVAIHRISGDIIECGVWRGGACMYARGVLNAMHEDRLVFVADSFQGLPPPDVVRYPHDAGDMYHTAEWLRVTQKAVRANFVKIGLLDDLASDTANELARDRVRGVVFLPGFFQESLTKKRLAKAGLNKIAVLRLDADMYGSTMQIFEALYDRVSLGGIVIVDDYSGISCQKAVHDFRTLRGITAPMQTIDWTGIWWAKA